MKNNIKSHEYIYGDPVFVLINKNWIPGSVRGYTGEDLRVELLESPGKSQIIVIPDGSINKMVSFRKMSWSDDVDSIGLLFDPSTKSKCQIG